MSGERFRSIPERDSIVEKVPYITPGRIARKLSVEVIKRGLLDRLASDGILPTSESKSILAELHQKADGTTPWDMVFEHTVPVRNSIYLLANKHAHPDMWMRDYEHTSEFTESPRMDDNVLKTFENRQRKNGQAPTAVGIFGHTPWHYADDESSLSYVIKTAQLTRVDASTFTPRRREKVRGSLGFFGEHVSNGMYVTPKGERRGWLDSFIYPRSDVVTQNQGLYAVALLSASELGFGIDAEEIKTAIQLYNSLAEDFNGYLPLSAHFNEAPDISALYPEYLAITMFDQQMLSDSVVSATLEQTPMSRHGYKVLTMSPKGEYFDPAYFVTGYEQGKYQNGGMWPIWHNNALVVGELHALVKPESYRGAVMQQLDETDWPESIRTGGEFEDRITPENLRQAWDVKIPAQHRVLDKLAA